jgi:hypothetical protein
MHLAAFVAVLALCMVHVGRRGDARDMAAGMVLTGQFAMEHVFSGNFPVTAAIYCGALWLFVAYSVKRTGAVLGVLSGLLALWAVAAWAGLVPSAKGAGIAFNYHNHVTILMYGQIFALWRLTGREASVA